MSTCNRDPDAAGPAGRCLCGCGSAPADVGAGRQYADLHLSGACCAFWRYWLSDVGLVHSVPASGRPTRLVCWLARGWYCLRPCRTWVSVRVSTRMSPSSLRHHVRAQAWVAMCLTGRRCSAVTERCTDAAAPSPLVSRARSVAAGAAVRITLRSPPGQPRRRCGCGYIDCARTTAFQPAGTGKPRAAGGRRVAPGASGGGGRRPGRTRRAQRPCTARVGRLSDQYACS
jgi:hypothetical protein